MEEPKKQHPIIRHTKHIASHAKTHTQRAGAALHSDIKAMSPWRVVESLAVLLIALQLTVIAINFFNGNRPITGLKLENQPIAQLLGKDSYQRISDVIADYENRPITIKAAEYTGTFTWRQLGQQASQDQIYEQALRVGHEGSLLDQLIDQNRAFVGAYNLTIGHPNLNHTLTKEFIQTINQQVEAAPVNALFKIENGTVVIVPDQPGKAIDSDQAITHLLAADTSTSQTIDLPVKTTDAVVRTASLEPLRDQAERIVGQPLTVTAADKSVTLSPEQLLGLIIPKVGEPTEQDPHPATQLTFDESKLNAIIDDLGKQAAIAAQPTIMSGAQVVKQGTEGRQVKEGASGALVLSALIERQTGAHNLQTVDIPMTQVSPPVVHQDAGNVTNRTGTGLIRLTFDDGPGGYTHQILDILARYNVHATFYVIGRNIGGHVDQMQRTVNEGHTVANHSYSHANLATLSAAGVDSEISNTQTAILQSTGVTARNFRPPYGAQNATVRSVAASHGLSIDMWSIDPQDWARPGSAAIKNRVLSRTHPGAVILLHVLNSQTVDALPGIIEGIRAQGYTLE